MPNRFRPISILMILALVAPLAAAGEEEKTPLPEGKTWTNKDLEALQGSGGISFLGGGVYERLDLDTTGEKPEAWWRERADMHARRLDDLDKRIAALEAQRTRAANPYTRSMVEPVEQADGSLRIPSVAELQGEIDRLNRARQAEIQGVRELESVARGKGVPEDWLGGLSSTASGSDQAPSEERGARRTRPVPGGSR